MSRALSPRRVAARSSGEALLVIPVLVVLLIALLLAPGAQVTRDRGAGSSGAPVQSALLGCPGGASTDRAGAAGTQTTYALASVQPPGRSLDSDGTVEAAGTPDLVRGSQATLTPASARRVEVAGSLAQGLIARRADTRSRVASAVSACVAPRSTWWFPGAGSAVGHTSILTLANLDTSPAVVDLEAYAPEGPLDISAAGGTGIVVAPGERLELPLVELLPPSDEITLAVRTDRGRVVAGVLDTVATASGDGVEWLPPTARASNNVRLVGLAGRPRSRTLLITNPSPVSNLVRVELATSNGRVVPSSLTEVRVEPESVAVVDLEDLAESLPDAPGGAGRAAYAVELTAARGITATIRSVVAGSNAEVSYTPSVTPSGGVQAVPVVGETRIALSAGGATARALATAVDAEGEPTGTFRFSLAETSTGVWRVPADTAYVVVEPSQGRVFGAAVYGPAGGVRAALGLTPLEIDVMVPAVRPVG